MIQGVAWHELGILYILAYPKFDLGEVKKPTLTDPSHTFSNSGYSNIRLRESEDSIGYMALCRHSILSGLSKMLVGQGRESKAASGQRGKSHTFSPSDYPKIRL